MKSSIAFIPYLLNPERVRDARFAANGILWILRNQNVFYLNQSFGNRLTFFGQGIVCLDWFSALNIVKNDFQKTFTLPFHN
jgi:hypothetical protein